MARDIFDYVARDLTSPEGAFYTAEDADSAPPEAAHAEVGGQKSEVSHRKAEGAFYVWTAAELRAVLGGDYELFAAHFGVEADGNVPAHLDPHGELQRKNILAQRGTLDETARQFGLAPELATRRLQAALTRLRAVRAARPRPQLDDKILAANNALMISALAKAHRVLGDREYLDTARRAAEFLERELYDPARGVLYRSWRDGRGAAEGFAEDYAFLVQALLDLYEASFAMRWLQWAERLQAKMDELFWDAAAGGYFNSAAADASIVLRLKEDYDGAEPAPSSVAAMNLLRLAAIFGEGKSGQEKRAGYRERGLRTLAAFRGGWQRAPHALPQMLCAWELAFAPPRQVVLAGDPQADDFRALAEVLAERLGPHRTVLAADGGEDQRWLAARAPWLAKMKPLAGRATAYVCEAFACQAPVTEPMALRRALEISEA